MSRTPPHQHRPAYFAAPLFYTWGFATAQLYIALRSTMIMHRKFNPANSLRIIEQHSPHAVFLVPTMLRHMIGILPDSYDIGATPLKIIAPYSSAVPERIITKTLERFELVLYSRHGSTEVNWTITAAPDGLKASPVMAGCAPLGTCVQILDEDGNRVADDEIGRIFMGNNMLYEGYTRSGADKQVVDDMVHIGDLGRMENGLLYISGHEGDMIVSGGENISPRQIEDILNQFEGIRECAAAGVSDGRFDQVPVAWVVRDDSPEDRALANEQIRTYIKRYLSRSAVSREIIFLDELPHNAVSKVVPHHLPKPWENTTEEKVVQSTETVVE